MIDEGLGGGEINEKYDKNKLNSPISDKEKEHEEEKETEMIENLEDVKKLGKEMEQMKTNKQTKEEGKTPDPIQNTSES